VISVKKDIAVGAEPGRYAGYGMTGLTTDHLAPMTEKQNDSLNVVSVPLLHFKGTVVQILSLKYISGWRP